MTRTSGIYKELDPFSTIVTVTGIVMTIYTILGHTLAFISLLLPLPRKIE